MNTSVSTKVIKNKIELLKLAQQLDSVSKACKVMGFSRDSFAWIHSYNTERTHSGKHCFDKTPWQTFIDSKSLALEKQLERTMPTAHTAI